MISAFDQCFSLTTVTIPDSVTHICEEAFRSCNSLESIELPASLVYIGPSAFNGCSSLRNISFAGTVNQWNRIDKRANWNAYIPATEVICTDGTVSLN